MQSKPAECQPLQFSLPKLLIKIVVSIFFSEALVMYLVHLFEIDPKISTLLDPILLIVFLLPTFVLFVYSPINNLLLIHREYEKKLKQAHDALGKTVEERTEELFAKNEALYREINEKKAVEGLLLEKNAFLEVVIESLDHPFYVIDTQTYEIKLANSAAGFKDLPSGAKCYELTHHRDSPCSGDDGDPCLLKHVVETRKPQVAIHTHFNPDGTKKQVELHTHPIFDEYNRVSSVIEFVMDCDMRRQESAPINVD